MIAFSTWLVGGSSFSLAVASQSAAHTVEGLQRFDCKLLKRLAAPEGTRLKTCRKIIGDYKRQDCHDSNRTLYLQFLE